MGKMKISIIIPVYNVESYISDCLKSVMSQTYQGELECILVDDCGTDNSISIEEEFISNYKGSIEFKFLHHHKNRGLSAARNTGMAAATGDYIYFLDSDDTLSSDCLESLTAPLKNCDYDLIVGDFRMVCDGKILPPYSMNLQLSNGTILKNEEIIKSYRKMWNMMAQNKLYKTSFVRANQLEFKEALIHEDELWSFEVACMAKSLYAVNKVTYYYLKRNSGITGSESKGNRYKMLSEVVREMGDFVKKKGVYNKAIHLRINSFFFRVLNNYSISQSEYVKVYKYMYSRTRPSVSQLIRAIGWDIRWYLMDIHYLLPERIAPYWMYYTISKPLSYLGILKK